MAVKRVTLGHFMLLIYLLILLGAGGLLFTVVREAKAANENLGAVDAEQLHKAITSAANYLVRVCKPDGKFVYRINLDPGITPIERYNVLRHAGTMYALAMYYKWSSDEKALEILVRASRFLQNNCVAPVPGKKDLLAVWSDPEITRSDKPRQAKLGGTALGLIALLSLEMAKPGSTSLADLRKLGRFVLYLQKGDGSFYSKYIPTEGGRQDSWTSLYYPSEAALGLLMLYHRDPASEWLEASAREWGISAWVMNTRDGRVEAVLEGEKQQVEDMFS